MTAAASQSTGALALLLLLALAARCSASMSVIKQRVCTAWCWWAAAPSQGSASSGPGDPRGLRRCAAQMQQSLSSAPGITGCEGADVAAVLLPAGVVTSAVVGVSPVLLAPLVAECCWLLASGSPLLIVAAAAVAHIV
jgi:hypothetical protein